MKTKSSDRVYGRIYKHVSRVPYGKVTTYGWVAKHVSGCTARMVGYAMASLPPQSDVPWHRVINRLGMVSDRKIPYGGILQRTMLESEGVQFNDTGKIDLSRFGWGHPGIINK